MPAIVACVACDEQFEVPSTSSPSPDHKDKKGKACAGGGMISKVIQAETGTQPGAPDSGADSKS